MKLKLLASALLLTIVGCSSSSTGRQQITLFSPSQLNQMGAKSFEELKQKEKISTNKAAISFVNCVADNITRNVPQSVHKGDWEVVVFESDQVNAFALPGGKIGVYTGLLKVTEDQHQLAAVMGHEVAHVIEQHSNERLSAGSLANTGMQIGAVAVAAADMKNESKQLTMLAASLATQYLVLMPYNRVHEKEADIVGQQLMATSGFKPKASVDLWYNMAKQSKGAPPEFLSTHPSHETRIKKLSNHLKVTEPLFKASTQKPNCFKPKSI